MQGIHSAKAGKRISGPLFGRPDGSIQAKGTSFQLPENDDVLDFSFNGKSETFMEVG